MKKRRSEKEREAAAEWPSGPLRCAKCSIISAYPRRCEDA